MYGVSRSGKNAPMYGKNLNEDTKLILSEKAKIRMNTSESRKRSSDTAKRTMSNPIHLQNIKNKNSKSYTLIINNEILIIKNLNEYVKNNGLSQYDGICIRKLHNGVIKKYKHYFSIHLYKIIDGIPILKTTEHLFQ